VSAPGPLTPPEISCATTAPIGQVEYSIPIGPSSPPNTTATHKNWDMRAISQAASGLFMGIAISTRDIAQQIISVTRSMTAVGWLAAEATRFAEVGFKKPAEFQATGYLYSPDNQLLCTDTYTTQLDLQPREGVFLADWAPGVFILGLVIAEVCQEALHGLDTLLSRYHVDRQLAAIHRSDLKPESSTQTPPEICQENLFLQKLVDNVLQAGHYTCAAMAQGGLVTMGVAMSAELFRSGIPLLPFHGMNDLKLAAASAQPLNVSRTFNCDTKEQAPHIAIGGQYDLNGVLAFPAFFTAHVEAKELINLLFTIGITCNIIGRALGQLNQNFDLNYAQNNLQTQSYNSTSTQVNRTLNQLKKRNLVPANYESYARFELEQKFNLPTSTPKPRWLQPMAEARQLTHRLGNVTMVSAYVARLITTGIPFISSGFNGISAGEPLNFDFTIDEQLENYRLTAQGDFQVAPSKLQHIASELFTPLLVIGFTTQYISHYLGVIENKHTLLKQLKSSDALAQDGVQLTAQQLKTASLASNLGPDSRELMRTKLSNTWQALREFTHQHIRQEISSTAAIALADLMSGLTHAVGLFGISLVIGTQMAAEFVGGSQILADGEVSGEFNATGKILLNATPIAQSSSQLDSFNETIDIIEIPNPSQITGITMLVGAITGVLLLSLSRGFNFAIHRLVDQQFLQGFTNYCDKQQDTVTPVSHQETPALVAIEPRAINESIVDVD